MECVGDAAPDLALFDCVEAYQNVKQVTEEFASEVVIVNQAITILTGKGFMNLDIRTYSLKPCSFPYFSINPYVEVTVNRAMRPKIPVYLKKEVLRVGFQQDTPFPDDFCPAIDNRDHDFLKHEGFGIYTEALNQLDEKRRARRITHVFCIKCKIGNKEPLFSRGTWGGFPD